MKTNFNNVVKSPITIKKLFIELKIDDSLMFKDAIGEFSRALSSQNTDTSEGASVFNKEVKFPEVSEFKFDMMGRKIFEMRRKENKVTKKDDPVEKIKSSLEGRRNFEVLKDELNGYFKKVQVKK